MKFITVNMPVDGTQNLHVNVIGRSLVFTLIEWKLDKRRMFCKAVLFSKFQKSTETGEKQIMAKQLASLINYLQVQILKEEFEFPNQITL